MEAENKKLVVREGWKENKENYKTPEVSVFSVKHAMNGEDWGNLFSPKCNPV